jgi:hypothetical protein
LPSRAGAALVMAYTQGHELTNTKLISAKTGSSTAQAQAR